MELQTLPPDPAPDSSPKPNRPRQSRPRQDEPHGIEALYARHLDSVFGYVKYRVQDVMEAEDITAETFAAAFLALPKFQGRSTPLAWLLGIARRKIAESMRRRERIRRRELLEVELDDDSKELLTSLFAVDYRELPEEALLHSEAVEMMRRLVDRLTPPQKEALMLQIHQGLTIQEIADVMDRSKQAANSLLERARARIFENGAGYFR